MFARLDELGRDELGRGWVKREAEGYNMNIPTRLEGEVWGWGVN